jgi:hypothetical protein
VTFRTAGLIASALTLGLGAAACDLSARDEATSTPRETTAATQPDIRSSLEGTTVLPRHVPWTASVVPADRIAEVRFVVDGSRLWVDSTPPYSYGEEGAVLATSRLYESYKDKPDRPGHRFTVKVVANDGSLWGETVVARVAKPRTLRRAPIYGIWGRRPMSVLANPESAKEHGGYTGSLHMLGTWLWVGRTIDRAYLYELSASRNRLEIGVPIFIGSHGETTTISGWSFTGYQCPADGPPATYSWSWTKERFGPFNEQHLILKAEREPCAARRKILQGLWEILD